MSLAQKWTVGILMIGLVTAATLPGRNTAPVIIAIQRFLSGVLGTAITGKVR